MLSSYLRSNLKNLYLSLRLVLLVEESRIIVQICTMKSAFVGSSSSSFHFSLFVFLILIEKIKICIGSCVAYREGVNLIVFVQSIIYDDFDATDKTLSALCVVLFMFRAMFCKMGVIVEGFFSFLIA